jgi:putative membrane protein
VQWFDECEGLQGVEIMMVGMFFFWGLLIFICFYLMKNYINGSRKPSNPIDILKERLAKGEISEEDFDQMKEKL